VAGGRGDVRVSERAAVVSATCALVLAALVAGLLTENVRGFYFPFSEAVLAIACAVTGAVITSRRPHHAVGRILLWAGLVLSAAQFMAPFAPGPISDPASTSGTAGAVVSMLQFASLTMLTALIARFPDGAWTTPWSKRLFLAFAALVATHLVLLVAGDLAGASLEGPRTLPFRLVPWVGVVLTVHVVAHLLRSDPTRRRQMAWVLVAFVVALTPEAIIEGLDLSLGPAGGVIRGLLVSLIPASIGVAVTRYRLYEIDRVISRTLTYGIVIVAMVAVFATVLVALGVILGGQDDLAVAIATLASVAASVPLARRVRDWVDRRFFRYRYDAASVVARVADDLRTTVDLTEVERRAGAVVDEVFAPEAVGIWLAGETP
jgi:hypothetical protein